MFFKCVHIYINLHKLLLLSISSNNLQSSNLLSSVFHSSSFVSLQPNRGVFLRNLGLLHPWRWWNRRLRRKVGGGEGYWLPVLSSLSYLLWRWIQWCRFSVAAANLATVLRYFLLPAVWFMRKLIKWKVKVRWLVSN